MLFKIKWYSTLKRKAGKLFSIIIQTTLIINWLFNKLKRYKPVKFLKKRNVLVNEKKIVDYIFGISISLKLVLTFVSVISPDNMVHNLLGDS